MMKHEFEKLAIRGDESISDMLYDSIERLYMSENNYHRFHGGVDETKSDFVRRVFGGKVNTAKTITKKLLAEKIRENTYCLQGCAVASDKKRMDEMNALIAEQTAFEAIGNCGSEYWEMKKILLKML